MGVDGAARATPLEAGVRFVSHIDDSRLDLLTSVLHGSCYLILLHHVLLRNHHVRRLDVALLGLHHHLPLLNRYFAVQGLLALAAEVVVGRLFLAALACLLVVASLVAVATAVRVASGVTWNRLKKVKK